MQTFRPVQRWWSSLPEVDQGLIGVGLFFSTVVFFVLAMFVLTLS